MAEESYQEKTERATPKRREDTRKKGQVARSMELNSVTILFFGLVSLSFLSGWIFQQVSGGFTSNYALIPNLDLTPSSAHEIFKANGFRILRTVFPMMVVIIIGGILINFAQVGALFTLEPITPKAEKLDLTKGVKRIFSRKTAVEFLRDILKVTIIGTVAFLTIRAEFPKIYLLVDQSAGQVLVFCATTTLKLGLRIALALLFLAILDYAFQRFEQEKNMRMTRQEVKEELKEYEGDPQIKSRVKRIQREMSRKRMLKDVETADVVVTNPTHIAVALRYDMEKDEAPLLVAKGERLIAEKIKEIARKFDIPIVENRPLAKSLFELAEVGMQIPDRLYRAVAEVLAYVYNQKGKI